MKAKKGSAFEREICKQLSNWWTNGKRDDVFWRSSQSGGRATQRAKSGKTTYGSYGDIAAVDPIGEPLLKLFTIELKRGSTYSIPGDLLDFKEDNSKHPWVKCLNQAVEAHKRAGSKSWMIISRRDHRSAMAIIDWRVWRCFKNKHNMVPRAQFNLCGQVFVVVQLDDFYFNVDAKEIHQVLEFFPT